MTTPEYAWVSANKLRSPAGYGFSGSGVAVTIGAEGDVVAVLFQAAAVISAISRVFKRKRLMA
jgi:hypothetical protein